MAYLGNSPARSFISFERQVFTIVNSQTAYTLDHSVTNENDLRLVINNIVQEPGSGKAYTASGTTLTLSAALVNGTDEMYCVFLGRAVGTVNAPAGSVGTSQLEDDAVTLAKMAPGTDGNIISYDASGNPVAVATGTAGQVLTSAGAGAPPTFAAVSAETNLPYVYLSRSSNQTMSASTFTNIQWNNTILDTASGYDSSDYRYTPNVAGKYFFTCTIQSTYTTSAPVNEYLSVRKNGTSVIQSSHRGNGHGYGNISQACGIITMNGSSDYIDVRAYGDPGGSYIAEGDSTEARSYFLGFLVSTT